LSKAQTGQKKGGVEDLIENVAKALFKLLIIASHGFKNKWLKDGLFWSIYFLMLTSCLVMSIGRVGRNYFLLGSNNPNFFVRWLFNLSYMDQFLIFSIGTTLITLVLLGIGHARQFKKYQLAIERAGLKSGNGETPKVKDVVAKDEYRKKLIIQTFGVGKNKFESQKDSLTTGLGENIEGINLVKSNKSLIEVHLCAEDIPEYIDFHKLYKHIKEPYSFIVGKAMEGPIVQSIRSLPHMLISGTTGGGKSIFFRSTMLSLLKSSPHIQLYLLDLKRGIEVKEFSVLPNVKTVKTEDECIKYLGEIVNEMERRFDYLEKVGKKKIEPGKDKFDLIIVGIDEAAALFGKKGNELATTYISDLAKLARAAAIHIIPATQKPVDKAIDTVTLDNLPGRMTFKMISTPASNAATGGNFAKHLPATKGRAVWLHGSRIVEVQAPIIKDADAEVEIEIINSEFESGQRKNLQPLLKLAQVENKAKKLKDLLGNKK